MNGFGSPFPPFSGIPGLGLGGILAAGGWTRDAGPPAVVRLTTSTDQVGIGTVAPLAGSKLDVVQDDANNATVTDVVVIDHTTSGAAAANIGTAILFRTERTDGTLVNSGRIAAVLTATGAGTEDSALDFYTRTAGGALTARWRIATAGGLTPLTDNTLPLGTSSLRVSSGSFGSTGAQVFATSGAANAVAQITSAGLGLGQGAGVPVAWFLVCNGTTTTRADMTINTTIVAAGTGGFEVRTALTDVNANARLLASTLTLGVAGGASAPDTRFTRSAAKTVTFDDAASGSATFISLGVMNTQGRIVAVRTRVFGDSGYTAVAADYALLWDPTGGNCTQNLPAAVTGTVYVVKHDSASANTVTIVANGAETIDGGSPALGTRQSITLIGKAGVGWSIV